MFKFIHAADIHLDSPLRGLEQYEGAPVQEIRDAARRALENLVDLALDENVAFVLIAGDLYDGDWRDYNTGLYFIKQATRLAAAGIPLYLIAGNHDAANRMTRSLRLPKHVKFFSHEAPETAVVEHLDVAIHGQSFGQAAVFDDLSQAYPAARPGLLNIGLLHTSASGREGHERYAPCTLESLRLKDYDYWALGHVHTREMLCESPIIAFPGNIQGRHIRETGPKGCLLVTVGDDRSLNAEFRPLDVLRWEFSTLDVSAAQTMDDVLDRVSQRLQRLHGQAAGRWLAVRLELVGATVAHRTLLARRESLIQEIRSLALEAGGGEVWLEKVPLRTTDGRRREGQQPEAQSTSDAAETQVPEGAIEELAALFAEVRNDPARLSEVGFELSDVLKKLPAELRELAAAEDPAWLGGVLAEAESWLMTRLLESEPSS